jgi:hypothetical protein
MCGKRNCRRGRWIEVNEGGELGGVDEGCDSLNRCEREGGGG